MSFLTAEHLSVHHAFRKLQRLSCPIDRVESGLRERLVTTRNLLAVFLREGQQAEIRDSTKCSSPHYHPCLAKDNRQKLETVQNAAARTITGCTKNTNTKLLLNEAKLLPLEVESTISQSAAYERSLRLPETDPSRKTAENPVRTRLRSLGTWRETGKDKAYVCGLEDFPREKLVPVPDIPPWQVPETFICCATLGEGISKADAPEELKKAVEDTMKKLNKPDV
ncbi:anoctamin [Elysia marginata]|uniref:Anoctamin n=1 Tax=Elysia marginata TaxID=1093978 RepID=A0AAV4HUN3_9GAST|nr:anoctamin [Elysia marginata]